MSANAITTITGNLPAYLAAATGISALTSIYTAPKSCSDRYVVNPGSSDAIWSTYSRPSYSAPVDPQYMPCLPYTYKGPYLSPAACTEGQTLASISEYQTAGQTTWLAQCCRSGMSIGTQTIQGTAVPMCISSLAKPIGVHAVITVTISGSKSEVYEYVDKGTTSSSIVTLSRGTAIADPLYVAWQSKDLSVFPAAYANALAKRISVDFTATATPTPGSSASLASSTSTSSPTDSSSSSSSNQPSNTADGGLTTAQKVGLGIGLGAGIPLLLAAAYAAFFLLRRRRQHARHESTPLVAKESPAWQHEPYHDGVAGGVAELPAAGGGNGQGPQKAVYRQDGAGGAAELPGGAAGYGYGYGRQGSLRRPPGVAELE